MKLGIIPKRSHAVLRSPFWPFTFKLAPLVVPLPAEFPVVFEFVFGFELEFPDCAAVFGVSWSWLFTKSIYESDDY